jgi:hypothetical protein
MEWEGKELLAVQVMEIMGDALIAHDDKLLLRGVKTRKTPGRNGGVGLDDEWWREVPKALDENGKYIVTGYWNSETGESHGPEWPEARERMAKEKGWQETFLRRLKLADGVWLSVKANQVDLTLANLNNDLRSRYRMALEHAVSMAVRGILRYKPRAGMSERNLMEAIRNRMKREFKPTEYEHEIILRGELGRETMKALKEAAESNPKIKAEEGTVYVQGYSRNKKTRVSVKYYDLGMRDADAGGRAGELFKLETTLHREYFRIEKLNVADMLLQPDIQAMISEELVRRLETVLSLIQCQSNGVRVMKAFQNELGLDSLSPTREMAQAMLRREMTLVERVAALERKAADHERRLAALEADKTTKGKYRS